MNERKTALAVLDRVFSENAYISLLMRDLNDQEVNTSFVSEIVYGTVRNYDLLEYQWRHFAKRHAKRKTALLLDMSIYQLFFMDHEQDYAVVNEAVNLASKQSRGFVNAILHQVIAQGRLTSESFAIETSHPAWLLSLWKAHYGQEIMEKIATADQERAVVFGRINQLKTTREMLEKDPSVHFKNNLSFTYDGNLLKSAYFQSGEVVIQDIHSAEAAAALDARAGMKVLDMCAAPGTKTQETAAFMNNRGEITACDLYEKRLSLIDDLMAKTGVTIVETKQCDATEPNQFPAHSFDRILLDVPCSGLGDLRHKPEIRFHIGAANIDALTETQHAILNYACEYLKAGGKMVYSTCTLNKKENERQVSRFLKEHPDFVLLFEQTRFPFEDEGDGFYHAVLQYRPENKEPIAG